MQQNSGRYVLDNTSDGTIVEIPYFLIQNMISYNAIQLNDELLICKQRWHLSKYFLFNDLMLAVRRQRFLPNIISYSTIF